MSSLASSYFPVWVTSHHFVYLQYSCVCVRFDQRYDPAIVYLPLIPSFSLNIIVHVNRSVVESEESCRCPTSHTAGVRCWVRWRSTRLASLYGSRRLQVVVLYRNADSITGRLGLGWVRSVPSSRVLSRCGSVLLCLTLCVSGMCE